MKIIYCALIREGIKWVRESRKTILNMLVKEPPHIIKFDELVLKKEKDKKSRLTFLALLLQSAI